MKTIKSSCSDYLRQYKKRRIKIFATARGYGELKRRMGISRRKSRTRRNTTAGACKRNYGRTGYGN